MSTMEIIRELPKLTPAERRAIQEKLLDLALEDDEVRLCDAAAVAGARMLDQMEDEDARRPQG
jgi:hypothetical protein